MVVQQSGEPVVGLHDLVEAAGGAAQRIVRPVHAVEREFDDHNAVAAVA
jgi:hypothetical protein